MIWWFMLHVHVTLFNISDEKIEPLSFCVIYPVGKKKLWVHLFVWFIRVWYYYVVSMKFQTGLLRMLPGSLNKLNLLYIFPYILVHV